MGRGRELLNEKLEGYHTIFLSHISFPGFLSTATLGVYVLVNNFEFAFSYDIFSFLELSFNFPRPRNMKRILVIMKKI